MIKKRDENSPTWLQIHTEARPFGAASGHHYGKYRGALRSAEIPDLGDFLGPREGLGGKMLPVYLENLGIRTIFVRQLDGWF